MVISNPGMLYKADLDLDMNPGPLEKADSITKFVSAKNSFLANSRVLTLNITIVF